MAISDHQIEWLTQEEVLVFDNLTKLLAIVGTTSRSKKWYRMFSLIFWLAAYIPMIVGLTVTAVHYIKDLDFLAYTLHHLVLITVAVFVTHLVVPLFDTQILYVMNASKNTYNYESDFVENYAKKIIRKRIKLSRTITKMIYFGMVWIMLEVQVFFMIETFFLKSYQTVFPLAIGLDLNRWLVFVPVVLWQELIVYYTTFLPTTLAVLCYTAWSHLDLEMRILTYAIANVQKIVNEKLSQDGGPGSVSEIYVSYCNHFAKHHADIISEYRLAVSWITPLVFFIGAILFITVGLSLMSDNLGIKLKLFWFLVVQYIVIYFWCLISQKIGEKSEEISEVVVSTPWWLMPRSCQSTLLLIMTRCKKPLVLSTPLGADVNVESFMEMMKSVYQAISVVYQMKTTS
uniref:Odorant receptor n=1 Tax=Adelphocoris lineolatus TaxID=236346 RepID=A0A2I4PH77_ADELI|nr:olfactory receptor 73 [Adelphocoris lineolatus]